MPQERLWARGAACFWRPIDMNSAVNRKKLPKTNVQLARFLCAHDAGTPPPASRGLQRIDVGAARGENLPCTFEASLLVMGNAGDQIKPLLQTFHDGDSFE